ncbi:MAG: uridine diphosphate-N-acetylglucosamine-binding protein YvcK [Candidatus Moranbacteria bacterium]|nr:uridine diphosphate-N-acetylglucosamine-binding protein YvcK [Candidatus Moranbacteria bacterium]
MKQKIKSITFIGGTGASVIGEAAKKNKNWSVNLLVSLVDDGGSTGRLMRDLNIPPVGDIRKALTALSTLKKELSLSFEHRFPKGELKGHTMGNIFLSALIQQTKNLNLSIQHAKNLLKVQGDVLTTTLKPTKLKTEFSSGQTIIGEDNLDENKDKTIGSPVKYELIKDSPANPKAVKRLLNSDYIVIGPGDLGANSIAPLLTKGIKNAVQKSKAKLIYIANLMTKLGETHAFSVNDCLNLIEQTLDRKFDFIILNNKKPPKNLLLAYQKQEEYPMQFDIKALKAKKAKIVETDLLNKNIYQKPKSDPLRRSLIRHDGAKTTKILKKI